jgi:CubicO group peptidase (beta-lactamase class C family)
MKRSLLTVILLVLLVVGICLAGSTTSPSSGTGAPVSPSYTAAPPTPPSGDLNRTLTQIDTYAEQARQRWNVPGVAIAVVKDGTIVFAKGYGVRTAGGSDPVTTDSVFQIGSTTKAFTAALVAQEVDAGRMNWSDPVVRYLPDFQMNDSWVTKEFTLTDALAQRSGLDEKWGQDMATLGFNRSEMIHALRYAEPVTSFRSEYRYQNIPFLVAAAAVERTNGRTWEENLRTRIFTPLSMTSATTGYDAFRSSTDHVGLHMIGALPNGTVGPVPIDPDWQFNHFTDEMGPAGGINADVKDMAAWLIFQLGNGTFAGKQVVSAGNLAFMHNPQTPIAGEMTADSKSYYCQGWGYMEKNGTPSVLQHTGETLGNHACVMLVPGENLGIVVLANEAGPSLPEEIADRFYGLYFGTSGQEVESAAADVDQAMTAFVFPEKTPRPEHPASPLPLESYTGSYGSSVYGDATVALADGNLTLTLGKEPVTLSLSPWDGNTFQAACPAWQWGPAYNGRVVFETGPDGRTVRQLTTTLFLQQLFNQTATFVRSGAV